MSSLAGLSRVQPEFSTGGLTAAVRCAPGDLRIRWVLTDGKCAHQSVCGRPRTAEAGRLLTAGRLPVELPNAAEPS